MNGKFVAYYRVSTNQQKESGLGLQAQKFAIATYLNGGNWKLLKEFEETESGKRKDRPELLAAIAFCVKTKAILLIAKLDRLARNAAFLLNLVESGVQFVAVDMPNANKLTVGIMALVAEQESDAISARTKAALQAAKARGVRLGSPNPFASIKAHVEAKKDQARAFAEKMRPVIDEVWERELSLRQLANELNQRGYRTPTGKEFKAQSVANLCAYLAKNDS